jgi:hypothetical protein
MNLKKLLKDNKAIIATITAAIGTIGWLANNQMNKIKKQDEILEIVQSAEFKNAVIQIIDIALNQKGGINSQISDIKNLLERGKEKMQHLENADEVDYRELNEKISKNRDAGIDRYISNIERVRESDIRSCDRDLRSCERDLQIYSDLLKIKSR